MLSVLLQGQLLNDPQARTSANGRTYATATVRTPTDEDALLCSVICFDDNAVESLLQLGKGDAVAVSGTAKLTKWTGKDGAEHTGLSITGHKVMSNYTATKKRRVQNDHNDHNEHDAARMS